MEGITTVAGFRCAIHPHGKPLTFEQSFKVSPNLRVGSRAKSPMHPCLGRNPRIGHHRKPTVAGMSVVCTSLW